MKNWNVVKARKQAKMSQLDLSKLLGISITGYTLKENGNNDFKLREIKKLMKLFKKQFEELF